MLHETEKFVWTEARESTLRSLWDEGRTAAQIATEIGAGVSRNAVIGKAARLKLPPRKAAASLGGAAYARAQKLIARKPVVAKPTVGSKGQKSAQGIMHRMAAKAAPPPVKVEPLPKPVNDMAPLVGLEHRLKDQCAWIAGDALAPDAAFCGRPVVEGKSWCQHHYDRVFKRLPA